MNNLIDKGISVLEFTDLGSQKPRFCSSFCYLLGVLSLARPSSTVISVFSVSVVVHLLSHVWLFVIPWNTAQQASLCLTLLELAQTHVHQVGEAIQPSCSLLSPSPAFNLSQHQGLFNESKLHIK